MKFTDEDGSDIDDEDRDGGEDSFMHSYSDALNNELKNTTLKKSFIHANEEPSKKTEVMSLYTCKYLTVNFVLLDRVITV